MQPEHKERALLSPHKTFVIQFRTGEPAHGLRWQGRVEHVVSGQAKPFGSLTELLTFIRQVLALPPAHSPHLGMRQPQRSSPHHKLVPHHEDPARALKNEADSE